jgi:hypothetical protein
MQILLGRKKREKTSNPESRAKKKRSERNLTVAAIAWLDWEQERVAKPQHEKKYCNILSYSITNEEKGGKVRNGRVTVSLPTYGWMSKIWYFGCFVGTRPPPTKRTSPDRQIYVCPTRCNYFGTMIWMLILNIIIYGSLTISKATVSEVGRIEQKF